jgi:hypothetical protein
MSQLHIIDHPPPSTSWQLLQACAEPGDTVLLTQTAVASEVVFAVDLRVAHLIDHARLLGCHGAGEAWNYTQWVDAAASMSVRCWHGNDEEGHDNNG